MKIEHLDGQRLFFIEQQDVIEILEKGVFDGYKLMHAEILQQSLSEYKDYRGVELAFLGSKGRYSLICFVTINDKKFRVHLENVICEHCDKRNGVSGTPSMRDLYFQCTEPHKIWEEAMSLTVKSCKHCNNLLKRRHTIWFEDDNRS